MSSPATELKAEASSSHLPLVGPFANLYNRFSSWRHSLDLPNPGTVENIQKEVKATHLTNFFFDGGRADLTKSVSLNPAFQVTHSFAFGSQVAPPSYNFGAVFANNNLFLQGGMDNEGNLNMRFNQGWTPNNVTKVHGQISSQVGHSHQPLPSRFDWNLLGGLLTITSTSYLAKYTSTDKSWIATAQVQSSGILQATYWQKLSDKVDVAADLQMIAAPARRDAVATLGAKYDLRMSTFRAQLDSTGKVSALLEQRFAPTFAFMVAGEIDHFKNSAKVGVGVMLESTTLTPEEMGMPPQGGMPYPPAP
ncbi:Tom40 family protein [Abortiporus biennis]